MGCSRPLGVPDGTARWDSGEIPVLGATGPRQAVCGTGAAWAALFLTWSIIDAEAERLETKPNTARDLWTFLSQRLVSCHTRAFQSILPALSPTSNLGVTAVGVPLSHHLL